MIRLTTTLLRLTSPNSRTRFFCYLLLLGLALAFRRRRHINVEQTKVFSFFNGIGNYQPQQIKYQNMYQNFSLATKHIIFSILFSYFVLIFWYGAFIQFNTSRSSRLNIHINTINIHTKNKLTDENYILCFNIM